MIHQQGLSKQYLHAFLDGRDVPPRSARGFIFQNRKTISTIGSGQIASIVGRYYAMDRDHRWERTQIAYDLLTAGKRNIAASATEGLKKAYAINESDEFVKATIIHLFSTNRIEDNDIVIFMNFRADRARQLSFALTDPHFNGFKRKIFHIC